MATFTSGALHYLAMEEKIWGFPRTIIALDIRTEKYRQMELLDDIDYKTYNVVTGALQGCLYAIAICFNDTVNISMMKDYGVKEFWTMLYSFQGRMP
ncbi:hypothetical protein QUC31_000975 [Theobroma cacao]